MFRIRIEYPLVPHIVFAAQVHTSGNSTPSLILRSVPVPSQSRANRAPICARVRCPHTRVSIPAPAAAPNTSATASTSVNGSPRFTTLGATPKRTSIPGTPLRTSQSDQGHGLRPRPPERQSSTHVSPRSSRPFFMPHSFINVRPILRIPFVPAMLKALASELGRLTNRPFL